MFRVVVEQFKTADEAVEFRNAIQSGEPNKLVYIEKAFPDTKWLTWTFK